MSDAFTIYLRNEESVLLMQRADGVADFPGAWDGIYGIGDPEDLDAVVARITEVTGIEAENLQFVRSGDARGLAFGNRLNDVTPMLFVSSVNEVDARGLYKSFEWVDPGNIGTKEYATPQGYSRRDLWSSQSAFHARLHLRRSFSSAPCREVDWQSRRIYYANEEL